MGGKRTSARVTAYVPQKLVAELDEWATAENRSVSNLAGNILEKAVETRRQEAEQEKKK